MKRIALKIDVDTRRGTLVGVPALIDLLQRHEAQATFFFSLGRDRCTWQTGKLSPGRYYDLATRCEALLPPREIASVAADRLRQARDAGFEVGIHAWDRVRWEQQAASAENRWVENAMALAYRRFAEVLGEPAQAHAAAGWQMNRHALRLTQRLGFAYASDCRGECPFIPVVDGEIVLCPQVPTTLPTIDELLAAGTLSPAQAVAEIGNRAASAGPEHVFTLRAELEGMRFRSEFEHLLTNWRSLGYQLLTIREFLTSRDLARLPRHAVRFTEVPGRSGRQMVQGGVFLPPD